MKTFLSRLAIAAAIILVLPLSSCKKEIEISGISLDPDSITLEVGETRTIEATVNSNGAGTPTLKWSSSNNNVASVLNGIVTAKGAGTATITVSASGKSASCKVTVVDSRTLELNYKEATVRVKESLQLTATLEPGGEDADADWTSSDYDVVTVYRGLVTAWRVGTAVVTARLGEKTASCTITVKYTEAVERDREALIAIFNANNGDNWSDLSKFGWGSYRPLNEWVGVYTNNDGRVTELHLRDDNLYGSIPKEIGNLSELEKLSFINDNPYNPPCGQIPSEISNLKKLNYFHLWYYDIEGPLPESMGDLGNLEVLSICHAESLGTSPIPAWIGKLSNLKELTLFDCNLSGTVPDEIGNLSALEELALFDNHLSGQMPPCFSRLVSLKKLRMAGNRFTGPIPESYHNLEHFWSFWAMAFDNCGITMDDIRAANIPTPKSPAIKTVGGDILNVDEEFSKNQYTVLYSFNPQSGDALRILEKLADLYKAYKDKGLGIITSFDNNSDDVGGYQQERDDAFINAHKDVGADWKYFIFHMYDEYPDGAPFYAEYGDWLYPGGWENSLIVFGPEKTVTFTTTLVGSNSELYKAIDYLNEVL